MEEEINMAIIALENHHIDSSAIYELLQKYKEYENLNIKLAETLSRCIPISVIEKKIEELDMRIKHLRKELEKSCEERETFGTETEIDNNEAYIFHVEEELNYRCAERNALRKLLDERNNTDV